MSSKGRSSGAWIVVMAVSVVAIVSLLPLEKLSNGRLSDFNLIEDILEDDTTAVEEYEINTSVSIDSVLAKAMAEAKARKAIKTTAIDSVDSLGMEQVWEPTEINCVVERTADGVLPIEDYTAGGMGLMRLREKLAGSGFARMAIVGDSYIEGDIFCQNVRESLQSLYGGCGVGYVNLYSEFPGFRRSVKQSGSGWICHVPGEKGSLKDYQWLAERYFTNDQNAVAKYKGVDKLKHLNEWSKSRYLFISPGDCSVTTVVNGVETVHKIVGSESVQQIVTETMAISSFEVKIDGGNVVSLGVWHDGVAGIGVDCMSSRGFSGLTLAGISESLSSDMRKYIDYDLIVLEFGINAITPGQKNFDVYSERMASVVDHLHKCYPESDILIMGVGDRGQKRSGVVHSMSSMPYMVAAQRQCAQRSGCLFWDTRSAMGGEDAIVEWVSKGLANKDYIHLNHKGGAELAKEFVAAIKLSLQ